jgi:hypothetical protein
MEPQSHLDRFRERIRRLVRRRRARKPEIKVYAARPDGRHAARARELMERPEFARFREKK